MRIASEWEAGSERFSWLPYHYHINYPSPLTPTPPPSPPFCREPSTCKKNHIYYYQDRHGYHASIKATHFKNEAMKGPQEIPLSPSLLQPLASLEKAIHASAPSSTTLFFGQDGTPYKGPYFSYVTSKAMPLGEGIHIKANDVRHLFATLWRDFINSPSTQLINLTITQLNASAADLMLNSTQAWSASYDDSLRDRAIITTFSLWPKFQEFVKQAHLDHMSTKEWDPLTTSLTCLPSP